ncbi:MAG: pilus assembly protein [Alphaproteobacteria bacterium]|nr:MAG: pilus assembly protein [Alphaproteobacteria bacterium]
MTHILLNRLWTNRRGNAAVEMALLMPILMVMFAGITEIGYAFYQASALERGLRAGATYASRVELPMSADAKTITENLVKSASMDGALGVSASNWEADGATFTITVTDRDVGSVTVSVIKLEAQVPFSPLTNQLWELLNVPTQFIEVSHEQASLAL